MALTSSDSSGGSAFVRILVVCTGNICRSAVAERVLQDRLDAAGIPAVVRSAGTFGGIANDQDTITAAAQAGIDMSDHQSRLLTADLIRTDGADLIITMSPHHTQAVAGYDVDAWTRTFTLPEIVRRVDNVTPEGPFSAWVADVNAGRTGTDIMNDDPRDSVPDPHGQSGKAHRNMVANVTDLVERLVHEMPTDI